MAESSNTSPQTSAPCRYFCHQCLTEVTLNVPEYTCSQCDSGFIEEIEAPSHAASVNLDHDQAANQFTQLFGPQFASLFQPPPGGSALVGAQQVNGGPVHHGHRFIVRHQGPLRRGVDGTGGTAADGNVSLQGFLEHLLGGLAGGTVVHTNVWPAGGAATTGASPFAPFMNLHGNPGDYAWGNAGLDNVITQLLNQMEGSGPPPAEKTQIDALPVVTITAADVGKTLQCSVCMEDFKEGEETRQMPCSHRYHHDCIVPWLQLHATCPVCRKNMSGEDPAGTRDNGAASSSTPASTDANVTNNTFTAPRGYDWMDEFD